MQHWYHFSSAGMENALIGLPTMRRFGVIDLISNWFSDDPTNRAFRPC
jgi:hypothetical protein